MALALESLVSILEVPEIQDQILEVLVAILGPALGWDRILESHLVLGPILDLDQILEVPLDPQVVAAAVVVEVLPLEAHLEPLLSIHREEEEELLLLSIEHQFAGVLAKCAWFRAHCRKCAQLCDPGLYFAVDNRVHAGNCAHAGNSVCVSRSCACRQSCACTHECVCCLQCACRANVCIQALVCMEAIVCMQSTVCM